MLSYFSSTVHPVNTILFSSLPSQLQNTVIQKSGTPPPYPITNIPASFDARQKWPGLITGPLDQETCGSSWAFSTITCTSDRWRITYPNDLELQEMIPSYYPNYPTTSEAYSVLDNISSYQLVSCDLCSYLINYYPKYATYFEGPKALCNQAFGGGVIPFAFDYLLRRGANNILATDPISCNPATQPCPCKYTPNAFVFKVK